MVQSCNIPKTRVKSEGYVNWEPECVITASAGEFIERIFQCVVCKVYVLQTDVR